jgi:maltooligosyltrehalose trehalohydrolase
MPTLGALPSAGAVSFCVWAPDHDRVELVVNDAAPRSLTRDADGYWTGRFSDVRVGDRYGYRLAGQDAVFPDPASRSQPDGIHGRSQVVDPAAYRWSDHAWRPPPADALVFYELHVGTFTPEGTFRAAIDRLPYLADLGVTAVELMPVGDFPGDRNWGYDVAAMFAPARCYGAPDDLRALVDAAHRHGLAIVLDVVYNHFGPDGAYAVAFSPSYLTEAHESPWGRGVNVDGPRSAHVRRFFIENALHWVNEYHVDGLRLDATHAIHDASDPHFLAELTATVRAGAPRPVVIVAEDHRNLAAMLRPIANGGWGVDAVWADDLHHELRVHTAGDAEGYYEDFTGSTGDIARTIQQGWFYTGQASRHLGVARGTDPSGLDAAQFVVCLQNHDQIGNRADGARLTREITQETFRALSALLLLAPETPLLFMGQEWAATTPFLFFTDHHDELGRQVTEGRRAEFAAFAAFRDPERRAAIPDPQALGTFIASHLDWSEPAQPPHAGMLRLYRALLAERRSRRTLRAAAASPLRQLSDARAVDDDTIALWTADASGRESRVLVARLMTAGDVSLTVTGSADVVLTTEDPSFAAGPRPIAIETDGHQLRLSFARPGAVVFRGFRLA